SGIGDIGNIVLRDRRILSEEGLVIVVVSINMKEFKIASGPDIISRGFVYMRESEDLIKEAQKLVSRHLQKVMERKTTQWSELKNEISHTLSPSLHNTFKLPPLLSPIIMPVQAAQLPREPVAAVSTVGYRPAGSIIPRQYQVLFHTH